MKIIQLADIHFGTEDPAALQMAEEYITAAAPDALIICGDLTQRGKRNEFVAARQWLDGFELPKLVVAGNHDTPMLNLVARATTPFERYKELFGEFSNNLAVGHLHFSGMNTSRGWQARKNWAEGSVDLSKLPGADESSDKLQVLVTHHPLLSPAKSPLVTRTRRGREAARQLAVSSCALHLCGHVHSPTVERHSFDGGSYVAVTAGTLSTRVRNLPPGFNVLDFDKDEVNITGVTLMADRKTTEQDLGTWSLTNDQSPA
jgi:3',5'-cyclic AMP phosphodiesterase CpdA